MVVIKLSPNDLNTEIKKEDNSFLSVREVETGALESLFLVAANAQKDVRKINTCYDLADEVKNLNAAEVFKISPSDLKDYLIPAFEKTVDQRPASWRYAKNMFKSIEKAEEIEV